MSSLFEVPFLTESWTNFGLGQLHSIPGHVLEISRSMLVWSTGKETH